MMWTPQKTINDKYGRIVALIDMDCFYCQVEEQLNPALSGKPIIVQPLQYDDYGGGGIIALNYVAKARGVKRSMRGDEAKKVCPDLELVRVPVVRGKADLSKYRNAGKQVAAVLQTFSPLMTRASVDEAYLDLTERVHSRLSDMNTGKYSLHPGALSNTFAVGYRDIGEYVQYVTNKVTKTTDDDDEDLEYLSDERDLEDFKKNDIKLLIASSIVNEIRASVKEKTGYECSAGIAHNKILSKLVCGMNKPNKQTLLSLKQIPEFYKTLSIQKVQGLGGKLGERICNELNIQYMADLLQFSKEELQQRFDTKNGQWLYNLARGIDLEHMVKPRLVPKSISCSKMFPRHNAITELKMLEHWLHEIAKDVIERVEEDELENNRRAKQMVVTYSQSINNVDVSSSRSVNITTIDEDKIVNDAINVIKKNTVKFFKSDDGNVLNNPIKYLGYNVNKFECLDKQTKTIGDLFLKGPKKKVEATGNDTSVASRSVQDESPFLNDNSNSETSETFLSKYHVEFVENAVDSSGEENSEDEIAQNEMLIETTNSEPNQIVQQDSPDPAAPSTSCNVNYMQTYAEFYKPPVVQKVECSQCGKMIIASELQVHTDEHLAFQLNQEQRAEFQNSLKRANESKTPVKVKKKQKTTSHKKAEITSIQKYLVKKRDCTPEPTTSTTSTYEVERCSECGKEVRIVELFEHMDFHAAKRLQDELMKTEMKANRTNNTAVRDNNSNNKNSNKNKKSNKKVLNSKNTVVRNITAFFQSVD